MMKNNYVLFAIMILLSVITIGYLTTKNNGKSYNEIIVDWPIEGTNENAVLETIQNQENIKIISVVPFEDGFLAFGSKDEYPYMANIKSNESYDSVIETDFNDVKGEIIKVEINDIFIRATIQTNNNTVEYDFFVSSNKIISFHKKQLTMNYSVGVKIKPIYFVIHETANTRVGADANAHYRYWSTNPTARASTHFVVDSTQIYQMLELDQMAWHVGDNKGYSDIVNSNTIGIELAVNADGDYEQTRKNAIELTIRVMNALNMNINQLKTHNDASGKYDPIIMLDNPHLWIDFVQRVEAGLNQ